MIMNTGTAERSERGWGLISYEKEEWCLGGFSPETFSSHAPFRSKERLFWKPSSHVQPMLVVKKSQYKFQRSRLYEIFEKKFNKRRASGL